jgi:hypothetical protein
MDPITASALLDELTKIAARRMDKEILKGAIGEADLPGVPSSAVGLYRSMKGSLGGGSLHKSFDKTTGAADPLAAKKDVSGMMDRIRDNLAKGRAPEAAKPGEAKIPLPKGPKQEHTDSWKALLAN